MISPMKKELLYATTNPGKVAEIRRHLAGHGIIILSPQDLGIKLDVPETGKNLDENAVIKARAYGKLAGGRLVMTDDTGIEIAALNGEPGIRVRYWKDGKTRMGDEEIIEYALQELMGVPLEKRQAEFWKQPIP